MGFDKNYAAISTPLLVLSILQEEDMYGYQIIKELEIRSNKEFTFKEGSLYPVLYLLNETGMLSVRLEKDKNTNRMRKYYSLTKEGRKYFLKKKLEWDRFSCSLNSLLKGYDNG